VISVNAKNEHEHNGTVNLEVFVPKQSSLHVSSGDGAVSVDGVSGEITLRSGDGAIVPALLQCIGDVQLRQFQAASNHREIARRDVMTVLLDANPDLHRRTAGVVHTREKAKVARDIAAS
jgi:hypothetical protein